MSGGSNPADVFGVEPTTRMGMDEDLPELLERQLQFPERYAVLDELGRGGMGTVYRAYDKTLSREVAIKRLHGHLVDQQARQRLAREARAMAQLNHRNVVAVYDVTEIDGDPMVVMEYVQGETLSTWLAAGPHPPEQVLSRYLAAGRGLAAAHTAGIVHHDFKPGNVLVGDDGTVKVTDFGLAKPQDSEAETSPVEPSGDDSSSSWSSGITQGGVVMGTPHYMAPEQHTGAASSPRSDQFSFCIALAEALLGHRLFQASDVRALYQAKLVVAPLLDDDALPKPVAPVLKRGLAREPEQRYESMEALLTELEPPKPKARRWVLGAAVAAALAGGVAVGSWATEETPEPEVPCTTSTALIADVWDERTRAELAASLRSAEGDWVDTTSKYVLTAADDFAEQWAAAHRDACEDTLIRNEQSDRAMDVRMSCLRDAKNRFSVGVQTLTSKGEKAAAGGPRFVDKLPNIDRCADAEAIDAAFPEDPAIAARVETGREDLADIQAIDKKGNIDEALAAIESVLEEAQAIGFDPFTAECLHQKAAITAVRDTKASMALNYEALDMALDSDHRTLGVTIMMGLSYGETRGGETHTGERLGRIAAALAPPRSATRGMALANRATAHLEARETEQALVLLGEAQEILEEAFGPEDARLAVLVMNRGVAEERRSNYRASHRYFSRAHELSSTAYGESHPLVLQIRMAQANAMANLGAAGPALSTRMSVRDATHETFGHPSPRAMQFDLELAGGLHALGRYDEAEQLYESVLAYEAPGMDWAHARASLLHANLKLTRGDEDAEQSAETALETCKSELCQEGSVAIVRMLLLTGQGKPAAAVEQAEDWMARHHRQGNCWSFEAIIFVEALERAGDPRADVALRTALECATTDRVALAHLKKSR